MCKNICFNTYSKTNC